jgi:hypothetical protein
MRRKEKNHKAGFNQHQLNQLSDLMTERINHGLIEYTEAVLMPFLDVLFAEQEYNLKDHMDKKFATKEDLDRKFVKLNKT